jgi:hypothetical protein
MYAEKGSSLNHQKTRSMSFRIPEDVAEALETDAQINNTSTSTLLTQILKHHMEYDGNVGRAGLIAFPKSLLVRLMDGYPEEKVMAMADHISQDVMTDMIAILQNEYSIESFLRIIESWARVSHIPFTRETKGNLNTFVVQHNMSKNWSLFLSHLYKNVIEELAERKVSVDITNNSVRIRF